MARHYEGSTQAGNDQPTIGEDAAPDELSIGEAGCEEQLGDSMDTARVSSSVDGCGKDRNYANALGYGELGRDFGHSVVHGHGKPGPATCALLVVGREEGQSNGVSVPTTIIAWEQQG